MKDFLQKLQELPESHRRILAVLTMVFIVAVSFPIMAGYFNNNLSNYVTSGPTPEKANKDVRQKQGPAPIDWILQSAAVLKSIGAGVLKDFSEGIGLVVYKIADAEKKLFPGFNIFLASIFNF